MIAVEILPHLSEKRGPQHPPKNRPRWDRGQGRRRDRRAGPTRSSHRPASRRSRCVRPRCYPAAPRHRRSRRRRRKRSVWPVPWSGARRNRRVVKPRVGSDPSRLEAVSQPTSPPAVSRSRRALFGTAPWFSPSLAPRPLPGTSRGRSSGSVVTLRGPSDTRRMAYRGPAPPTAQRRP